MSDLGCHAACGCSRLQVYVIAQITNLMII